MCQKGEQVVLELPDDIDPGKKNRTISADKCCVEVLKGLWGHHIQTLGHCCGHGECNPSIVVSSDYSRSDISHISFLIELVDNRKWDIYQWQLTKVKLTASAALLKKRRRSKCTRCLRNNELEI
ncbi:MAG: hypothetical protein PHY02_06490 [Phycisphaerae bacterium]|nr:hypothetical protein [Phycisphaerae bacterium]